MVSQEENKILEDIHLRGFFQFLAPHCAIRMKKLFYGNEKANRKFYSRLAHDIEFRDGVICKIPSKLHSPNGVHDLLVKKYVEVSKGYLISADLDLDGKFMAVDEALENIVGYGLGTFLSIVPGELGYMEFGEQGERYLVVRN